MLTFENVTMGFDNTVLFSELNLTFSAPRSLITGPNGSGKTTLLLLAAGLQTPQSGQVFFDGKPVNTAEAKSTMGISANKVALPPFLTAAELLRFHCNMHKCTFDPALLDTLGLTPFYHKKVSDLSLGNAKKLSIITALMHKPKLLLLDEPTNGLDESARMALLTLLNEYGGQLLVASHEITPSELGDAETRTMLSLLETQP